MFASAPSAGGSRAGPSPMAGQCLPAEERFLFFAGASRDSFWIPRRISVVFWLSRLCWTVAADYTRNVKRASRGPRSANPGMMTAFWTTASSVPLLPFILSAPTAARTRKPFPVILIAPPRNRPVLRHWFLSRNRCLERSSGSPWPFELMRTEALSTMPGMASRQAAHEFQTQNRGQARNLAR